MRSLTPRERSLLGGAARIAVAAAVLIGFAFFLRGLALPTLLDVLAQASLPPVLAATALNFVHMFWKGWRWQVMLAPVKRVGVFRLFRYTVASYAASTLLPARVGELVRVWLLRQRDGVPATAAAAVAVTDKLFEALAMLVVVAPIPWLLPGLPARVGAAIWILAGVGGLLLAVAWIAVPRARPGTVFGRFAAGAAVLRRPRDFLSCLAISLLAWGTDFVVILLSLRAVHVVAPWPAPLLVLLTVSVAVAVPSTPGQVGMFEMGAVLGLELLGVPRERALAFALVYHALQVMPLALIGIAELRLVAALRARAVTAPPLATGRELTP